MAGDQAPRWTQTQTPWDFVKNKYFHGQQLDADAFAQTHHVDVRHVRDVFANRVTTFSPELCRAFGKLLRDSPAYFEHLCECYDAAKPAA